MSSDAWPSPEAAPAPLPRLEDLPIAERGYDQEAVRQAFDSFYRHAAQLDTSLRALEAVEIFRRDADALRNDLRALRSLGLGGPSADPGWAVRSYERERREVSGAVLRLAFEAALLVAVAVVAGVGHFRTTVIVALMAGAFVIVALSEWLASRSRFVPPSIGFLAEGAPPAAYVEAYAPPWAGPQALEPAEDTEPDALTMISAPADGESVDPWEQGADDVDDESEPELAERSGFFRRRRR